MIHDMTTSTALGGSAGWACAPWLIAAVALIAAALTLAVARSMWAAERLADEVDLDRWLLAQLDRGTPVSLIAAMAHRSWYTSSDIRASLDRIARDVPSYAGIVLPRRIQ
jgi:hypothetical protein